MGRIEHLARKTSPDPAHTCSFEFQPDSEGVVVNRKVFRRGLLQGSQVFRMPGNHTFRARYGIATYLVEVRAKEYPRV